MALFGYRQWEGHLDLIDLLQWPAMVTTVLAAWLIGSLKPRRRMIGFVCFLLSNLLWVLWGWPREAWALVLLQFCLAGMNLRGLRKNEKLRAAPAGEAAAAVSPESSGH
ncbi:hypothetical protein [Pseudomonas mangrovi]|jgi:sugar phosphate permease|uniref:hypothetical protein n=1 Tax=Pseudomonas mangrovi TaxID=2161748 RepID=UPI0026AFBE36